MKVNLKYSAGIGKTMESTNINLSDRLTHQLLKLKVHNYQYNSSSLTVNTKNQED